MALDTYRRKRDAAKTPEPVPDDSGQSVDHTGDDQEGRGDTFVVQEHHATALHWDVRLERDGVLVSWAVPKGLPLDPKVNRLAKQTEDHPLAYATFGGDIPKGEYGGGHVSVWDHGTYELQTWSEREVKVVLAGERVQGRYVFVRTGRGWLVHRMDPSPEGWTPLPEGLAPMQATDGPLPGRSWAYEVEWPGRRVLAAVDGGRVSLSADLGVPELRGLGLQLGSTSVLLDGVLVVLGPDGVPDPDRLASRGVPKPGTALRRDAPLTLLLVDVLHTDGRSLLEQTWDDRRAVLEGLELRGDSWLVPDAFRSGGRAVLDATLARGLPGLVAKRRSSPYQPGTVSADWVRVRG